MPKNALTAMPSNFSKVTNKKGRPKTEKSLKSGVETVSTGSIRIVNSNILNFFIEKGKGKKVYGKKKTQRLESIR